MGCGTSSQQPKQGQAKEPPATLEGAEVSNAAIVADLGPARDEDIKSREAIEKTNQISKEVFQSGMTKLLNICIEGYPKAVRSTYARRNELLRKHSGNAELAKEDVFAQAAALKEETKSWLLGIIPYVGFPSSILYPTWKILRRVCILAGLYGHDLDAEATRARILHAFVGLRGVPMAEWCMELAVQAVWTSVAGPVAGMIPVGVLSTKLVNMEGAALNTMGAENFSEGSTPVPEATYQQELDPEPTMSDYMELAKAGSAYALVASFGLARAARATLTDTEKREQACADAVATGKAVTGHAAALGREVVKAAPGAAQAALSAAPGLGATAAKMGKQALEGAVAAPKK